VSTVIVLHSTVVLGVDLPNKEHHNTYRFEIRHAGSKENSTISVTRTFAASSRKARNSWVFAISEALLAYEKEKARKRKAATIGRGVIRSLSPPRQAGNEERVRSPSPNNQFEEAWIGDRFVSPRPSSPSSPLNGSPRLHNRSASMGSPLLSNRPKSPNALPKRPTTIQQASKSTTSAATVSL
jgi:hypothetical protein